MSWKRTLVLVFFLAAVIFFYHFRIQRFKPAGTPSFDASKRPDSKTVFSLSREDQIKRIRFQLKTVSGTAEKQTVILESGSERTWHIVEPVQAPAEPVIAEGFSALLRLSPRIRELSFTGLSGREYGFESPRQKVCVSTVRHSAERCLLIGSQGLVMPGAYAKWENESVFFLISPDFLKAFDKTLYALREKRVFPISGKNPVSVRVRLDGKEIEMVREKTGWAIHQPEAVMIGADSVQKIFFKLNQLYARDFVDHPSGENTEFSKAHCVIHILFEDGSGQTLVCGRVANGLDAYYVQNREQNAVYLVSTGKLDEIKKIFRDIAFP